MPLESAIFLVLYATLGGLSALLLLVGVIGRKVSVHPFCKRCGFDLDNNLAAAACPSCGAFLNVDGAIVHGRRAKRRGAVALGSLLLVLTLALAGSAWIAEQQGYDLNTLKPFPLLRVEAMGSDDLRSRAALAELETRLAGHHLPTHEHETLINLALARHGVADNPRRHLWARILDVAHDTHQLDTARYKQYQDQK